MKIAKIKPLSPNELMENLDSVIPDFVIDAVNNILKKKFRGSEVIILQEEIIQEILGSTDDGITRDRIYKEKWLDFESIFKKYGWQVVYDKPGFDEDYSAKFIFTPKNKK